MPQSVPDLEATGLMTLYSLLTASWPGQRLLRMPGVSDPTDQSQKDTRQTEVTAAGSDFSDE